MPPAVQLYSARQIAAALGRKRQAVARSLEGITPSGQVVVHGAVAAAWSLTALPAALQSELGREAQRRGYRDASSLLAKPPERWEPLLTWSAIREDDKAKATRLQAAFKTTMERLNLPGLTEAEIEAHGIEQYRREFGYPISPRHWRRILDRTIERDRGFEEWNRPALYLEEYAFTAVPCPARRPAEMEFDFTPVRDLVETMENRLKPTDGDRAFLWDASFRQFEHLVVAHPEEKRAVKGAILDFLFQTVPALSKTMKGLRRAFDRGYREWIEGGKAPKAMEDQRRLKSGNFRTPDFSEDHKKITHAAVQFGGSESLAHRHLRNTGALSPEFREYYSFDPRSAKSYVPNKVRSAVTPLVDMLGPIHRGPWEAKMRGPYIPRDWSAVQPGDFFSADDVTFNHYFFLYDELGQLQVVRGECLVVIDLRTGYPLDFMLIAGHYNSRHIRSLITKVHDKFGLPHIGFYFENSVWASRFIDGDGKKGSTHFRETMAGLRGEGLQVDSRESGLKEIGLDVEVAHATTPRAKTIEGLFHILQDRMRPLPGFCGFNERSENMERLDEAKRRVLAGKAHPADHFLEMDQWVKVISEILAEFANDPQNGKMLKGASPAEMWAEANQRRPLRKLPNEMRYKLATQRRRVKVQQHGIRITLGKNNDALYYNEETGKRIGREVEAFYNIDFPELLTVHDKQTQTYFSVKRVLLPAMSATKEQFAHAHQQAAGHMKAARALYGEIKHPTVSTITRDRFPTPEAKALGEFHNAAEARAKAEKSTSDRNLRKIQVEAAKRGATVLPGIKKPERVIEGMEWEKEIRAQLAQARLDSETAKATHEK